jgi:hypothetical protein
MAIMSIVKVIAISKIYKESQWFLVSVSQITQSSTLMDGQIVTERNISLLLLDELENDHYDAVLPVEEK